MKAAQRKTACLLPLGLCLAGISLTADERAPWDQEKAEQTVNEVLILEKAGKKPWDEINWETDPTAAVERSRRENKPLFLFLFMKKDVGPPDAPC